MPRPERILVHEQPVSFPKEFDPEVAQKFLPDWLLVASDGKVVFRQFFISAEGALSRRELLINLESHSVAVSVWNNNDKDDPDAVAMLGGVSKISLHTRFGHAWVTFESSDRYLVFQPRNMDIAITTSKKPLGSSMLLR